MLVPRGNKIRVPADTKSVKIVDKKAIISQSIDIRMLLHEGVYKEENGHIDLHSTIFETEEDDYLVFTDANSVKVVPILEKTGLIIISAKYDRELSEKYHTTRLGEHIYVGKKKTIGETASDVVLLLGLVICCAAIIAA